MGRDPDPREDGGDSLFRVERSERLARSGNSRRWGKGRRGNGQEPLAAVGDAGGSAMAKGNDGGGMELAARDRALQRYCVERRRMGKRRQSFRGSLRAAGAAGRRGGGTLLRGFVWTRVDAADARILLCLLFLAAPQDQCLGKSRPAFAFRKRRAARGLGSESDDPTTTQSHLDPAVV